MRRRDTSLPPAASRAQDHHPRAPYNWPFRRAHGTLSDAPKVMVLSLRALGPPIREPQEHASDNERCRQQRMQAQAFTAQRSHRARSQARIHIRVTGRKRERQPASAAYHRTRPVFAAGQRYKHHLRLNCGFLGRIASPERCARWASWLRSSPQTIAVLAYGRLPPRIGAAAPVVNVQVLSSGPACEVPFIVTRYLVLASNGVCAYMNTLVRR